MMKWILFLSDFIIPITVFIVILYGCIKKVDIYAAFIEGAKDGLKIVLEILPTLIGLMVAVAVLRAGGVLDLLTNLLRPVAEQTGFPAEIIPLCMMRLVSSSAATGLLVDLFQNFGPDSFLGRVASVMMSCTETVFYTMSVYYMSVAIKKTRYTLVCAILANIAGVVAAFYITRMVF